MSFPSGNPQTDPSIVGGAAWWWAQGTNPSSPYYDPSLHACLTTPCEFPIVGQEGDPGLDGSIGEWIAEIESITSEHLVPFTYDLTFGPFGPDEAQLTAAPGYGPEPVWSLGWESDNFQPQEYMQTLEYPNSTFTSSDAVEQQFTGTQYDDAAGCGHALDRSFANLVYWSHQSQLTSACQGVAWNVANWWDLAATGVANLAQQELDYNLIVHIFNALSLYTWYGTTNQVMTAAPWIAGSSINFNPVIGGSEEQPWFDIQYVTPEEPVTLKAVGLPAGSTWSASAGVPATSKTNTTVGSSGSLLFVSPNGPMRFEITPPAGYGVARVTGPHAPTIDTALITGPTTLTVHFGKLYTLYFNESIFLPSWPGLPAGLPWAVSLTPSGAGGPPGQTGTNTTVIDAASISFEVAKGTHYKFEITKPGAPTSPYSSSLSKGSLTMPGSDKEEKIKFRPLGSPISFKERGLPAHTGWSVTVTGPSPLLTQQTESSVSPSIKFLLTNGSYSYSIPDQGFFEPITATGSFVVSHPPHALPPVVVTFAQPPLHSSLIGPLPAIPSVEARSNAPPAIAVIRPEAIGSH
ncbi:MAG: hypothetical protein WBG19_08660 [Thermoplasmata archaeon]